MVTRDLVKEVANLNKINVTEKEVDYFVSQFDQIMQMIDLLNELDLKDMEPLTSVCEGGALRLRKDESVSLNIQEDLFLNAKYGKDLNCFVVPKVVE